MLDGWCSMKLLPSRGKFCVYPTCSHSPCRFMQSYIRTVHAYLAVNCHLHFWQNDRDLLRATAVTRGLNGYRNKSHHRKLTGGGCCSCGDSNPRPFNHESGALTTELFPLPKMHIPLQQLSTTWKIW